MSDTPRPYQLDYIQEFVDTFKLKGNTTEETVNNLLRLFAENDELNMGKALRNELISSCAVVLNGMRRIEDPVQLFHNLGVVFERRGWCIFTNTVVNAFNRLYADALKRKKGESEESRRRRSNQILNEWRSLKNPVTKAYSARFVPLAELHALIQKHPYDGSIRGGAVRSMADRRDVSFNELMPLVRSLKGGTHYELGSIYSAVVRKKGVTVSELRSLLSSPDEVLRFEAARSLASRKDVSEKEMALLARHHDLAIKQGLESGEQIRVKKRRFTPEAMIQDSRFALKDIHGKRAMRTREIIQRTASLRRGPK